MDSTTIVQQLLLGITGETAGGLLAGLLAAVSARVARRFRPEPQHQALQDALEEALTAALDTIPETTPLTHYYLDCLAAWLGREIVQEELSLLLDPEDSFDLERLRQEFTAITQGYTPEQIPDLDFDAFMAALTHAFYASVKRQPALQEVIKIERLDTLVSQLDTLQAEVVGLRAEAAATAAHTRQTSAILSDIRTTVDEMKTIATQVATVYWQQFEQQQLDQDRANLQAATARYFAYLFERYRYLDFRGMGMGDRVSLRLPLVDMYVPLQGRVQLPEGETWTRELRVAGGRINEAEMEAIGQRVSEPQPILDLLHSQPGLIILGDPGAGKTTFLKYLAVRLAAGEGAALALGRRLPILLPLSAYAQALTQGDISLDDFIPDYYRRQGIRLPLADMLAEALRQGGALFLLDGLDEVQSLAQRHLVVERLQAFFAFHRQPGNKFILTSRIVGYTDVRLNDPHLVECTLVDFDRPEIELFIDKWSLALEQAVTGGDSATARQAAAAEKKGLLEAIAHNRGVRRLATNPLLLTILALMKRQGVALPERRVELYDQYIRTLIRHWILGRGLDRRAGRELDVVETVRVLGALALWMHQTSPGKGLVKQAAVQRRLTRIYQERRHPEPDRAARRLLADARESAGLLVARGQRTYGFIHLTFQEYLAAVGIAQLGQSHLLPVVDLLGAHVGEADWHEVSLLTIGYMGIIQQRDEAAGEVLLDLIQAAPADPGEAVILAGEAVADVWPGGVTINCRQKVQQALAATLEGGDIAAQQRARAGAVLGRLGDARPGVGVLPAAAISPAATAKQLPDLQVCFVPAGPYWMSTDDQQGRVSEVLDYLYWIGRFPVTNAQFQAFVAAGGYKNPDFWPEARRAKVWRAGEVQGWDFLDKEPRREPYDFGPPFHLPNHPVVGVTWYEMLAFTRWLDGELALPAPWRVQLPSEAEWEKAARGGLVLPEEALVWPVAQVRDTLEPAVIDADNPQPRRRHPWGGSRIGDRLTTDLANYRATGLEATSAVGCFPQGVSPYGAVEMLGNVWEWTRSQYRDYPYDPRDGREIITEVTNSSLITLRGGSWYSSDSSCRCGARDSSTPRRRNFNYGFRVVLSPFIAAR